MGLSSERMYQEYLARGLEEHCLLPLLEEGGQSILDVGCGSGAYVRALAGKRAIRGVDASPFASWSGREGLFEVADAARLPYANETFETVSSFEVLEHLPDPDAALSEFRRVCRHNIIITVPNCEITPGMSASSLLYSHWRDPTHRNFYNLESIQKAVKKAGFEIVRAELANKINVVPFIVEAFGFSSGLPRFIRKLIKKRLRMKYCISILVIARKI